MITEIIYHNLTTFGFVVAIGIVAGICWTWNARIATGAFVAILTLLIATTIYDSRISTPMNVCPWYDYIGLLIGAFTWKVWFNDGKTIYMKAGGRSRITTKVMSIEDLRSEDFASIREYINELEAIVAKDEERSARRAE